MRYAAMLLTVVCATCLQQAAAAAEVSAGRLDANEFKFFSGAVTWAPGDLELEIQEGCWHTAAAARPLVLKQCLQLPVPLWREVLGLMGGEYAETARHDNWDE